MKQKTRSVGAACPKVNDSVNIGAYILSLDRERKKNITVLKIVKLAYLAHGWHLGFYDAPLAIDDVEAWPYGPVFGRLYSAVRRFKGDPIEELAGNFDLLTKQQKTLIGWVFDAYGDASDLALSALAHQKGPNASHAPNRTI